MACANKSQGLLRGVITPMVTPLRDHDTLDVAGLERLIEHIIAGKVQALFILGTTGEGPSMSYRLRHEIIDLTCAQVNGRVPVLVGITDTSFVESVSLARKAADAGANAVVLAPPYYFPVGQSELLEYLQHLASRLPLPLFLYNTSGHAKVSFELETVRQAAEIPNVVGLKDSSSNMTYLHQIQVMFKDHPDFSLLIGREELLGEAVLFGWHGGVCGGANIIPKLYVDLYTAAVAKDIEALTTLQQTVMLILTTIYSAASYGSNYLKGLKCALSCMGICNDFMAEPLHRLIGPERERIRGHLVDLGLLKSSDS